MTRQLIVPSADTKLYTVDTPGDAPPVLFLSGSATYRTGTASSSGNSGTPGDYSCGERSTTWDAEMRTVRAAVVEAEASNPRVSVFATTPHKHTQILSKAPDTVVAAIEAVVSQSS